MPSTHHPKNTLGTLESFFCNGDSGNPWKQYTGADGMSFYSCSCLFAKAHLVEGAWHPPIRHWLFHACLFLTRHDGALGVSLHKRTAFLPRSAKVSHGSCPQLWTGILTAIWAVLKRLSHSPCPIICLPRRLTQESYAQSLRGLAQMRALLMPNTILWQGPY